MRVIKSIVAATVIAGAVAGMAPASALSPIPIAFANFNSLGSATNVNWTNGNASNTSTHATFVSTATGSGGAGLAVVSFNYLVNGLPQGIRALFSLSAYVADAGAPGSGTAATITPVIPGVAYVNQSNVSGNFSFTADCNCGLGYQQIGTWKVYDGDNLLSSFNYAGTLVAGLQGSGPAAFTGNDPGYASVVYTSDYVNFTGSTVRDFSISLGQVNPTFTAKTGAAVSSFRALAGGSFGSNAVPEPAAWAMFIVGFGMIGMQTRRRRGMASVTA